jgi:hypothetical protein
MRSSITQLLASDAIALLPGWNNSLGAQLENEIAEKLRIRAKHVPYWLTKSGQDAYMARLVRK